MVIANNCNFLVSLLRNSSSLFFDENTSIQVSLGFTSSFTTGLKLGKYYLRVSLNPRILRENCYLRNFIQTPITINEIIIHVYDINFELIVKAAGENLAQLN